MRETVRSGWISCGVAVLVAAMWSGDVRADAVGPGPAECPDGATPNSCHGAEYCDPVLCAGDAACMGGKVCRDVSLCVRKQSCFGGQGGGEDTEVKDVVKACTEGVTCAEGACETLKVCVDPGDPTSGGPTSGGGTAGSSTASGGSDETGGTDKKSGCDCRSGGDAAPGLVLATLLGLVVRRRRR